MRTRNTRLVALLALGMFGDPAVAGQEATDMKLDDAGFVVRVADTPAKLARLRTLPPRKFIRRVKAGQPYFMYADPDTCKCVFVGDEDAMKSYRDMAAKRSPPLQLQLPNAAALPSGGVTPERSMIQDIDADAGSTIPEGDILDFKF
jgi:hypothetical protein